MKFSYLAILSVILILFIGCTQQVACNKPYIKVGNDCCLDENNNAICDKDEKPSDKGTLDTSISEKEIKRITEERTKEIIGDGTGKLDEAECDRTPTKRQFSKEPYYTGPLIDTHVHMPVASKTFSDVAIQSGFEDMPHVGQIPTGKIVCLMEKEGITKVYGFFLAPNIGLGQAVNHVKNIEEKYPAKFVRFFQPPLPIHSLNPEASDVKEIFSNNPELYQGYGEIRFDFNLGANANPEDEYFLEMYKLADEHNLIVQIHPNKGQVDALERLLKKYPNVKFLAHVMPTERDEVSRLMGSYNNLYYSLDAEIHYIFGYQTIQNNKGPTKEEYIKFMREKFDVLLKEALDNWKPIIEAHPDQFTWGSDRWYAWHYDPEVSGLVVEFGRTFIGHLKPEVQEKIAYKNAEKLLQER